MKWEYKTLDQLGIVSRGKSKHRPRNDPTLFGGEYPFIQTADVKAAPFYISEYSATYNEKGLEQSKLWHAGTLCITIAANIADTGILAMDACFPDSVMGFVPYDKISDVRFVKYSFDILQAKCKKISQGTAQDNLSWEKLSTIQFPAPPFATQKRIADILSTYDEMIENNQKQIKLLEETAQRLYKEWFVDLRFPGHETTHIVDGIPEGWSKEELGNIAVLRAGGDRPKVFSKVKTVECSVPVFSNGTEDEGLYGFTNLAEIYDPCVTISARGSVGYTCLRKVAFVPIVRLISVIPKQIEVEYLFYFLKNMVFESNGAAQQQITVPMIKNKQVVLPAKTVINLFVSKIRPMMDLREKLKNKISALSEARNRLLPKLMSGEIEV